jgi:hypothetical protein
VVVDLPAEVDAAANPDVLRQPAVQTEPEAVPVALGQLLVAVLASNSFVGDAGCLPKNWG